MSSPNPYANRVQNKTVNTQVVILFVIICVLFFAITFFYISWVGNTDRVLEEKYAKKIALDLSQMSMGMIKTIYITELVNAAAKNNYDSAEDRIILPIENGKVTVKVSRSGGSSFYSFSSIKPELTINTLTKELIIKT